MDFGWWAGAVAGLGRAAIVAAIVWWGTPWVARLVARWFAQNAYDQTFGAPFRLNLVALCVAACIGGALASVAGIWIEQEMRPEALLPAPSPTASAERIAKVSEWIALLAATVAGWLAVRQWLLLLAAVAVLLFVVSVRGQRGRALLLVSNRDPLRGG